MLHQSKGTLCYTAPRKVFVLVDPEIGSFYRSMIPKTVPISPPKFATHITVVRREPLPKAELFGIHDGEIIEFEYDTEIHHDETYYWLNAYSKRLEEIREELGLPVHSQYTRPPDNSWAFHITIGNLKNAS